MKKIKTTLKYIVVCLLVALSLVGCVIGQNTANDSTTAAIEAQDITENPDTRDKDSQPDAQSENGLPRAIQTGTPVSLADIPAYDGMSYIQLENNMPDFTEEEKKEIEILYNYIKAGEYDLDSLNTKLYDIPKEVAEYIADVFAENENAEVTVFAPAEKMNTRASYGSWSEPRTYKGYTLKDWIVEVENAFGMTDIASGSKAYSFAETICAYMGNALLDSFIPFGSATTTLYEFICANNTTVAASGGDKAYAAPMYTSYTKFTYVSIDGNQILGARTQKAKLETIMWYYYFDTIHEQKSAKQSYNRWIYTSAYSKPDEKAITWATSGGYIENTIAVRIGDKDFVLE